MSGYWDALERIRGGTSGSAEPRPLSLFEDEGGIPSEGFAEFDLELEGHAGAKAPAAGAAAPGPASAAGAPDLAAVPLPPSKSEEAPDASAIAAAEPEEPRAQEASAAPLSGTEQEPPASAPAPPERPAVTEVRTVETRTVVERIVERSTTADIVAPAAGPAPAAVTEAEPARDATGGEAAATIVEAIPALPAGPFAEAVSESAGNPVEAAPVAPIVVEIDTIEVRIEPPAFAPRSAPERQREQGPAPSLGDYLARRSGAGR